MIDETISQTELERFALDSLREYCKKSSIAVSGSKEVVVKRILEHLEDGEVVASKENSEPNLTGIRDIMCVVVVELFPGFFYIVMACVL